MEVANPDKPLVLALFFTDIKLCSLCSHFHNMQIKSIIIRYSGESFKHSLYQTYDIYLYIFSHVIYKFKKFIAVVSKIVER